MTLKRLSSARLPAGIGVLLFWVSTAQAASVTCNFMYQGHRLTAYITESNGAQVTWKEYKLGWGYPVCGSTTRPAPALGCSTGGNQHSFMQTVSLKGVMNRFGYYDYKASIFFGDTYHVPRPAPIIDVREVHCEEFND